MDTQKGRRGHFARERTQLAGTAPWVARPKPQIGSFCPLCLSRVCLKSIRVDVPQIKGRKSSSSLFGFFHFTTLCSFSPSELNQQTRAPVMPCHQVYVRTNCSGMICVCMLGNPREARVPKCTNPLPSSHPELLVLELSKY